MLYSLHSQLYIKVTLLFDFLILSTSWKFDATLFVFMLARCESLFDCDLNLIYQKFDEAGCLFSVLTCLVVLIM